MKNHLQEALNGENGICTYIPLFQFVRNMEETKKMYGKNLLLHLNNYLLMLKS